MYQKILAPVDGSVTSLRGLQEAIKLAKALKAKIYLLHVVNELIIDPSFGAVPVGPDFAVAMREGGQRILAGAERTVRDAQVECEASLVEVLGQRAADVILAHARKCSAELIVMGTHGRRGLSRVAMGSDAELVLRSSPVPVLLVRDTLERP